MQRGPKPHPTFLKIVRGNPGKRDLNHAEPKPRRVIPDPPEELSEDAKKEWVRVVPELDRLGMLTTIDRTALSAYCQAFGRWMQAERKLAQMAARDPVFDGMLIRTTNRNFIQNPMVGIANKAMADVMRYCVEFGMTPSARSRITATPRATEEDSTEEFFAS